MKQAVRDLAAEPPVFTRTRKRLVLGRPNKWNGAVVEPKPPKRCQYPVDSMEYIYFHQDVDGEWHDEDTCRTEKLGLYAPIDRNVEHISDDKIYDGSGHEIGIWWPNPTYH